MGKKPQAPMAVSERAKQFMPFKAVLGLDEALELKRIEKENEKKVIPFISINKRD